MYIGNIAKRYATALEAFSSQDNSSARCYADARRLIAALPAVGQYISAHIPKSCKLEMLERACEEPYCQSFEKFLELVVRHGRETLLKYILHSYLSIYKKDRGIVDTFLTVACEPSPALIEKLKELAVRQTAAKSVNIDITVDPSIIGGFLFRIEDRRLDSSVAGQLKELQRAFAPHRRNLMNN